MQKLTPGEISKVVVKIRERYDLYIYKYFKNRRLKLAFEDRYLEALNMGVDVSSFLLAEIGAIEELICREEEKVANGIVCRAVPKQGKKQGFADRILEEFAGLFAHRNDLNQKRGKYPAFFQGFCHRRTRPHLLGNIVILQQSCIVLIARINEIVIQMRQ